jgi:hypothetical protein
MFEQQMRPATKTSQYVREFAGLWPILKVSRLRELGIDLWRLRDVRRPERIDAYRRAGADKFEPQCFYDHEEVPLDWGHTLEALYRVRCNLFHGEKARIFEDDREIVSMAYESLRAFLDESHVLDLSRRWSNSNRVL